MSEPNKQQLVDEAEDLGINPDGLTKPELADAIGARQTPEVGPKVPADGEPVQFERHGSITGVQPLEADDIPEAGR